MRILVFATGRLLRDGIADLLQEECAVSDVVTVSSVQQLLDACLRGSPDVVLLELGQERVTEMTRVLGRLKRVAPSARLVGMPLGRQSETAARNLGQGDLSAVGSIRSGSAELIQHLGLSASRVETEESQCGGADVASPPIPIRETKVNRPPTGREVKANGPLTVREAVVLKYVAAGLTVAEIAKCLGISHKTIENHKQRIYSKLGVQNQSHAVAIALRAGMIPAQRPIARSEFASVGASD